jgi:hypothetical protein
MSAAVPMRRRERLPNRRPNVSRVIEWRTHKLHICAGLSRDGRILEIFCRSGRPASDIDELVDDAAVLLSRLLQHGDRLADIARGLGRLPGGEPASLVGAIADAVREIEQEIET